MHITGLTIETCVRTNSTVHALEYSFCCTGRVDIATLVCTFIDTKVVTAGAVLHRTLSWFSQKSWNSIFAFPKCNNPKQGGEKRWNFMWHNCFASYCESKLIDYLTAGSLSAKNKNILFAEWIYKLFWYMPKKVIYRHY